MIPSFFQVQSVMRLIALSGFYWIFAVAVLADDSASPRSGQKIAFLGDSITAFGWEQSTGYIHLVSQALAMQGRQIEVIPSGVQGDTSKTILARFTTDVLNKRPDWIVLGCGLNDVWYGTNGVPLDQYKQNVTSIINQAAAAGIKLIILTATMIGEDPSSSNNQILETYNEFLRSVAKENNLPIVDSHADIQDYLTKSRASNPSDTGNLLTIDGVHLNGVGNEIIASGILRAFGCSDADVAQAKAAWDELPNSVVLSPVKLSVRQYERMKELAMQRGCSIDKLVNDTFAASITSLLNTNSSPSDPASPAPPQMPKVGP